MPIQMIELEEVTMVEASDETLEATVTNAYNTSTMSCNPSGCGC
ncbi:hypothetical protein SAMN06295945_0640 [Polynucleobacter meluiroseus]|uniref:Thiazolylpeptide-type bacteriocin n=1 Tax=Polynucleobacter meluiroseus TaxID=1938814 RepID=A0A240DZ72_9BURK|nr:hypothetical protein SAMN06295945_0640 [Polynucleobacter meluiroseus]